MCKNCQSTQTRKRPDLTKINREKLFVDWLLGKNSLTEIGRNYNVTRQSLHTWFRAFWDKEPRPKSIKIRGQVLIVDGKYVARNASVLIAACGDKIASWYFVQRENYGSWKVFLDLLWQIPFAVVCDGKRGMIKAIKERFPGLIIQRCQFHVVQYCTSKLTRNPESRAAKELRALVLRISKIKTRDHLKVWLIDYKCWYQTHREFIKEKTYSPTERTPTGRRKWHYTHGRLHAAYSHLKNALPNLFQYLRYPQIPNTTNFVEGAINSPMQEKIRFHRGLDLFKKRILIAHFLASKQH